MRYATFTSKRHDPDSSYNEPSQPTHRTTLWLGGPTDSVNHQFTSSHGTSSTSQLTDSSLSFSQRNAAVQCKGPERLNPTIPRVLTLRYVRATLHDPYQTINPA